MLVRKIVFVSTILPFPVDAGKKVVVSGILSYLVERYGADNVTYVLLDSSANEPPRKAEMPCKCIVFKQPSLLRRLWNLFWFVTIKRVKSIQESMLFSASLSRDLRAVIGEINPDLTVCDTFRVGQFFETSGRPKGGYILYMDDLFSIRYKRMLDVLTRFPDSQLNVLGNFSRFIPAPARLLVRSALVQKLLLRVERRLVEKREQSCVRWFDTTLLINAQESSLLRRETGNSSIQTIKPLLTRANTRPHTARNYDGNPTFVFLGDLSLPHNRFSIAHFIETQMDRIIREIPDFKLRIIGKGADDELLRLVRRYEAAISIEGFVEDLATIFDTSCAMLIPLLFGSGVKIKTLEALSHGLPILSTSYGVEGVSVTHRVNGLVEDDIDRYSGMMSALTEVDYNDNLSCEARRLYLDNYSRERVLREYGRLFGSDHGL